MTGLFIQWLYLDAPESYWRTLRDLLLGLANYFSISLLASTLLAPWRHDAVDITRLPMNLWFQAIISNVVSRLIGLVVRGSTLFIGGLIIAGVTVAGVLIVACWYLLPILLISSIVYGIVIIGGARGI